MTDAVITEYAGSRRNDTISRFYQYGSGGVRVLDAKKNIRRLYQFDPAQDMMTERDPANPGRILRRFLFDRMGMLEETFTQGVRPRKFSYEQGCQVITVREGGEYGQVGKLFTFEGKGVSETAWGRNGEIERVFVFEDGDTITERSGGWFGDVTRTIVFEGIHASLFREPEAFLQFLMFSEWSTKDRDDHINDQVAKIRGGKPAPAAGNPFAFTGKRPAAAGPSAAAGRAPARAARGRGDDDGIDFIPDGDAPPEGAAVQQSRRSDSISFNERLNRGDDISRSAGKSAQIPVQERFEAARRDRETPLSRGRSVDIPMQERFEAARRDRETPLSKGRSVEIPLQERFESAHQEREKLSPGKSVEIPLEERFESVRGSREKLPRGRSADIPYDERRGGRR